MDGSRTKMELAINLPGLSSTTRRVFCASGVVLLFLPKINLVHIGDETAGIRIDDLVLATILAFLIASMLVGLRTFISKAEALFACLVGEALLSNCVNLALFHRSSVLYSFRIVEYFLFFYVGYYFSGSIVRVARWLLIANAVVMVLQQVGLVGAATSEGVASSIHGRAVGLTGGPWEVGAVINFCCALLVFDERARRRPNYSFAILLIGSGLLLLTGSRMASIAQVLLALVYYYLRSENGFRFLAISSVLVAALVSALILIPNPISKRSEKLFDTDNIRAFTALYQRTPDDPTVSGLADFTMADDTGDLSWVIRAAKWAGAIKAWNRSALSMLVGIGPGTLGPALDGGWLRVLSETGGAGLFLNLLFFRLILRNTGWQMRGVVLSLLISMLMIDIHIAYKAMSFFMFSLGYFYEKAITRGSHLSDAG